MQRDELHSNPNLVSLPKAMDHIAAKNVLFMYSICAVPIIYVQSETTKIVVNYTDGRSESDDLLQLTIGQSSNLFSRSGKLKAIEVHFDAKTLSS